MTPTLSCPAVKMVLAGNHFVERVRDPFRLAHGKKGGVVHSHCAITVTQESGSGQAS